MRPRRLLAASVLAGATALATLALAQTKPKAPAGKPAKPPAAAAKPDTSSAPSSSEEAPVDAGAAATGPVEPPPASEMTDGGLRASPLNPRPEELPSAAIDAGAPVDYDRLLADIAALRARIAALGDNLYQSRISVALQTDGDHGKIGRLTVSLDDGTVYTAPASFAASDMTTVYDHAVAPGRHAVTVDVDRKDDRDEAFKTSQRSRFTVDVPKDHKVDVQVKILDDSSMGADYASDRSGKYDLRFRVKAVAKPAGK